jgi:alcohol dehydrogenase (cytochrome c)
MTSTTTRLGISILVAYVALAAPAGALALESQAPTFTAAQAELGKMAYTQSCARCHGAHLDDGEFGPPLRGSAFKTHWAGRSVFELYSLTRRSMPPGATGQLGDDVYAQLIAYVLSANGFSGSARELPITETALSAMVFPGELNAGPDPRSGGPGGGLAPDVSLPPWPAQENPLQHFASVSDSLLANPPDQDWLLWRRTYDDGGFSPLRQITRQNVHRLHVAWSIALPPGPNEATPLVHDGVMFVYSYGDNVQAFNAATGDELWHYSRRLGPGVSATLQRNMALYRDKLYFATTDVSVVALDVKTGKLAWEQKIGDAQSGSRSTGGPLIVGGVLMQGTQGRAPGGQYIVGLDAETGKPLWRFNTIAQPGEPNGNSWNGLAREKRNGGSVWTAGSYDIAHGVALFGPAPTYDTGPMRYPVKQRGINNLALYTNATVALDPHTGKLVWDYQHVPNDQWDYDWAFERQVITVPFNGHAQRMIVTSGKEALYDALDADSGKYLFSMDLGLQNLFTAIDPKSGAKTLDPERIPGSGRVMSVCPHAGGAKNWTPASFNPSSYTLYVPLIESCMEMIPVAPGERGALSTGVRWALRPPQNSDGKYGRLQAVNLETRKTVWTVRQRAPQTSGVLDTAGGVLFAGAIDRFFTAYDDASGAVLWKTQLTDVPNTAPISFAVNGKQYVAVIAGNGGPIPATFIPFTPEITIAAARSGAIFVFELDDEDHP